MKKVLSMLTAFFCVILCVTLIACNKTQNDSTSSNSSSSSSSSSSSATASVVGKTFVFEDFTSTDTNDSFITEQKANGKGASLFFNTNGILEFKVPAQNMEAKLSYTENGSTITCSTIEVKIDGKVVKVLEDGPILFTYKDGKVTMTKMVDGYIDTTTFKE